MKNDVQNIPKQNVENLVKSGVETYRLYGKFKMRKVSAEKNDVQNIPKQKFLGRNEALAEHVTCIGDFRHSLQSLDNLRRNLPKITERSVRGNFEQNSLCPRDKAF